MSIPAWPEQAEDAGLEPGSKKKFAPRMDVVALEPNSDCPPQVAFWEAKTVGNGGLVSKSSPKVFRQLNLYECYLRRERYRSGVASAYRETCRILSDLHRMAARIAGGEEIPPLGNLITEAAAGSGLPCVDPKPRLVIFHARNRETGAFETRVGSWDDHFSRLVGKCGVLYEKDPCDVVLDASRLHGSR